MAYVCSGGLVVPAELLQRILADRYEAFLTTLIFTAERKIGPPITAQCFKLGMNRRGPKPVQYIYLPRGVLKKILDAGLFPVRNLLQQESPIAVEMTGELFPNQTVICNYIMQNIFSPERAAAGTASCVLNLEAGLGKTFVFTGLLARLRQKALYIAPNEHLMSQAVRDLGAVLDVNVASYADVKKRRKKHPTWSPDVIVIIINSALLQDKSFFREFPLICFDEVHMLCGEKRREIFWRANSRWTIGMSATINQNKYGFDKIYKRHLGDVIVAANLPGFNATQDVFKGVVRVVKYHGAEIYTRPCYLEATGKLFTPDMIKQMVADPDRNQVIVDEVMTLYNDPGNYIYVFFENREHAENIAQMLTNRGVPPAEITVLIGGIKMDEKANASVCRIISTTYSYSGTGISYDRMNCAVFATPRRSNYEQITRRICRRGGDMTRTRRFVDIVDENTLLKHQFRARKAVYDYFKWKCYYVNANNADPTNPTEDSDASVDSDISDVEYDDE